MIQIKLQPAFCVQLFLTQVFELHTVLQMIVGHHPIHEESPAADLSQTFFRAVDKKQTKVQQKFRVFFRLPYGDDPLTEQQSQRQNDKRENA